MTCNTMASDILYDVLHINKTVPMAAWHLCPRSHIRYDIYRHVRYATDLCVHIGGQLNMYC